MGIYPEPALAGSHMSCKLTEVRVSVYVVLWGRTELGEVVHNGCGCTRNVQEAEIKERRVHL